MKIHPIYLNPIGRIKCYKHSKRIVHNLEKIKEKDAIVGHGGNKELPVLEIKLDGKEHLEDAVVQERDRKKNAICRLYNMEIIRGEYSGVRRYNYIKEILMD